VPRVLKEWELFRGRLFRVLLHRLHWGVWAQKFSQ